MTKLWSGRFSNEPAEELEAFTESISFDKRLYNVDIQGSIAHAEMLEFIGVLTPEELEIILDGLSKIKNEIETDKFEFDIRFEDIHMAIESRLIDLTGDTGKKLHTARSRNDQIALDTRLYISKAIISLQKLIVELQKTIIGIAENHTETIMPGYTHMQRAQVVSLAHHLMAYYYMLRRDFKRLTDVRRRILEEMPLGAGALAGTTIEINRQYVTDSVQFMEPSANSMDSVSDRDYIIEFNSACAILMVHLSRFAEELIIWNTKEFSFIDIADHFATGSSMMPQKKNPDIPELIRGKSARVIGNLVQILTLLKGTPLTYNRDFQEDKESFFDSLDTSIACLTILTSFLKNINFNNKKMAEATQTGFLNATEVMEYLINQGVPNREAHAISGKAVTYSIMKDCKLEDLIKEDWLIIDERLENLVVEDLHEVIKIENCLKARKSAGGPAPEMVMENINLAKQETEELLAVLDEL